MERSDVLIEADELLDRIGEKNIRIFDASITDDAYQAGHIPGAVYFDHERFSEPQGKYEFTLLRNELLAVMIGQAGIANTDQVILYAPGMLPYAARAWWILRYAGHTNVHILNGGLSAWKKAGGSIEQEVHHYSPAEFHADFRLEMFVDKHTVVDALKDDSKTVVDVLPLQSFEGAHITGSANLSALELMQGMDYFLPNDQLLERLKDMSQFKQVITYCGGGIAAVVNAVAALMIGQDNVSVYDGSLAEWIGEGLPVTGSGKWEIWK